MATPKLSKKAHRVSEKISSSEGKKLNKDLINIEKEIDRTVARIYGINNDELIEIKKCLRILMEGKKKLKDDD